MYPDIEPWLRAIYKFFTNSDLGSFASLLSLGITFLVWRNVQAIKNNFLLAARLPKIIEALETNASNLSRFFNEFDNSIHEIDVELSKCKANLRSIEEKTNWRKRRALCDISKSIDRYLKKSPRNKTDARAIYTMLNGTVQELINWREDRSWSESNGD